MRFASCLLSRIGKDFRFHVRDRQRFYRLLDVEVACYLDSRTKALAAGIVIVGIERPSAFAATCGGDVKRKRRQEARAGSVGRKRGQEARAGSAECSTPKGSHLWMDRKLEGVPALSYIGPNFPARTDVVFIATRYEILGEHL